MSDKPTCWKCGGELKRAMKMQTAEEQYFCSSCQEFRCDREAFNPEHAKAHHEIAEKGPEIKQLTPERIEEIVECFETARVASATMKQLFPMLFNEPGLQGMPDPVAMGLMAGELLGHAIYLTQELNREHRWRVKREDQLRNAVALADLGKDGKGFLLAIDESGRIVDVVEHATTGSEYKPLKRDLMPLDEYEARVAAKDKAPAPAVSKVEP